MLAPTVELRKSDIIFMKILPFACRGLHCRPVNGAGPSPAPTVELRNNAKIYKRSLAVYGRGGALLHPGNLAAAQGFSGRAMLAPTMKLQTSDIIFMKILPFACRGLHGRPAAPLRRDLKWRCFFMPALPFADLRQEKMILHKCSLVLCTKMGYNKIKLLP